MLGRWSSTLVLLGLLGCGKPEAKTGTTAYSPRTAFNTGVAPPTGAAPTPPMSQAKAAFNLSAQQFYDEYTRAPKDAKAKFAGKVIELTGTVRATGTNPTAQPVLYLSVVGDPLGVLCIFFNPDANISEQVAKGQQVRVRGAWPEHSSVGCLADCVLLGR